MIISFMFIIVTMLLCSTAYAVTESELQAAIESQGKDAVSGNVFIWFLCAVAFLKISQKIDSFMAGLGVNVGRTGGSLMAEAMIAARSIGMGGKAILNKGFSGKPSASGSGDKGGFFSGGLAGVVGRNMNNSAISAATDKGGGLFGKKAFESSLKNDGDFAKDIIGKVATGDISKTGSITGETANKALSTYLGYSGSASETPVTQNDSMALPDDISAADSLLNPEEVSGTVPDTPPISLSGIELSPEQQSIEGQSPTIATTNSPGISDPHESPSIATMDTGIDVQSEINASSEPPTVSDTNISIGASPEIGNNEEPPIVSDTSMSAGTPTGLHEGEEPPIVSDTGMSVGVPPEISKNEEPPIVSDTSMSIGSQPETPIPDTINGEASSENTPMAPVGSMADTAENEQVADAGMIGGQESIPISTPVKANGDNSSMQAVNTGEIKTAVHTSQEVINQSKDTAQINGSIPTSGVPAQANVSGSTNQVESHASNISSNAMTSNISAIQQENINSLGSIPAEGTINIPTSSNNIIDSNTASIAGGYEPTQNTQSIPIFSEVEIGGGRITGMETSDNHPDGIAFGMYDTAQYMKPDGDFTTVKTVDGVQWYKQYAIDAVEKTPHLGENGKIKYDEKIIKKMPPVPRRKDRI